MSIQSRFIGFGGPQHLVIGFKPENMKDNTISKETDSMKNKTLRFNLRIA